MLKNLWEKATGKVHDTAQSAEQSAEAAKTGKRLLDHGGKPAADILLAKKQGFHAVACDKQVLELVHGLVEPLEESAAALRRGARGPRVDGITGYDRFDKLAASYEARAAAYRNVAQILRTPPEAPPLSPAEEAALPLVQMKEAFQRLSDKVSQYTHDARSSIARRGGA